MDARAQAAEGRAEQDAEGRRRCFCCCRSGYPHIHRGGVPGFPFLLVSSCLTRARARALENPRQYAENGAFQEPANCAFFPLNCAFFPLNCAFFPLCAFETSQHNTQAYCADFRVFVPKLFCSTNAREMAQLAREGDDDDDDDDFERSLFGLVSDKTDKPLSANNWVTFSNVLARAAHGLSLGEKRLLMLAISKLDSRAVLPTGSVPTTRIRAIEYAELFEVDPKTAYETLRDAAKALYKRSITFFEPAFKRNGKPLPDTIVTMRWIGQAHYQVGEGWIDLKWWPGVLPGLTGLRKRFTSYQLKQASALRSTYSWKLLELLMQYENKGWAEYTVEDFAASMEATPKQRQNFASIRRKIIEPAVAELTQKDGWTINWQQIKAGRRVTKVRFDFSRDPQGRLPV